MMPIEIAHPWNQTMDDDLVTMLITAIQHAAVRTVTGEEVVTDLVNSPAPELTAALLNVLASVLETAPACSTPRSMRRMSEAASKELLSLMRGVRELKRSSGGEAIH